MAENASSTVAPASPPADISLTKKAEAYVAHQQRRQFRARIEACLDEVHALIALLDDIDGDADFEPTLGAPEPKISGSWFTQGGGNQTHWADGLAEDGEAEPHEDDEPSLGGPSYYIEGRYEVDLELVNEDGGDINDEPHGDDHDGEPRYGFHKAEPDRPAAKALVARAMRLKGITPPDADTLRIVRPGLAIITGGRT